MHDFKRDERGRFTKGTAPGPGRRGKSRRCHTMVSDTAVALQLTFLAEDLIANETIHDANKRMMLKAIERIRTRLLTGDYPGGNTLDDEPLPPTPPLPPLPPLPPGTPDPRRPPPGHPDPPPCL